MKYERPIACIVLVPTLNILTEVYNNKTYLYVVHDLADLHHLSSIPEPRKYYWRTWRFGRVANSQNIAERQVQYGWSNEVFERTQVLFGGSHLVYANHKTPGTQR